MLSDVANRTMVVSKQATMTADNINTNFHS